MSFYIYNGELKQQHDLLDVENRGFLFGDGFFETMYFKNEDIAYFEDHLARLQKACNTVSLDYPFKDPESLKISICTLAERSALTEARVKIIVYRKSGGLFKPLGSDSEYIISVKDFKRAIAEKNEAVFSEKTRNSFSSYSSYKSLSSLKYILAGIEQSEKSADEIILLDVYGNVSECLSSNIFWITDSEIFTPDIETGCIDGILRKNIIKFCRKNNWKLKMGLYQKEAVLQADVLFTSNISGISLIKKLENSTYSGNEQYEELKRYFS